MSEMVSHTSKNKKHNMKLKFASSWLANISQLEQAAVGGRGVVVVPRVIHEHTPSRSYPVACGQTKTESLKGCGTKGGSFIFIIIIYFSVGNS